ncbi:MAG: metallophosphoesterase [Polyangiaceae bacterium]|nr:metallophosphoesterase [Polyangiaceae bacterium]
MTLRILFLLVLAFAANAVFVAWVGRIIGRRRITRYGLVVLLVVFAVALMDRSGYFGVMVALETVIVIFGAVLFGAFSAMLAAGKRLRARFFSSKVGAPFMAPDRAISESIPLADHRCREGAMNRAPTLGGRDAPMQGRRETLLAIAGAASWATSAGVIGWGFVRGRHDFELVEVPVRIAGLPRALDGYTIVQVSDLHAGRFVGERDFSRGFDLVRKARPDLFVATGDLVDHDSDFAPFVGSWLARVSARDGVYAILGNHDYYAHAPTVRRQLERAGIQVLVDDARLIRPNDGGGFALVGMNDLIAPYFDGAPPNLASALSRAAPSRPRILLAHQPRQFNEAAGQVALQLSGHTHGYQFDFLGAFPRLARRYVAGRYDKNGSVLWVNRGFGVSGPPSRVGVPPEVTKIVLVAG